MDNQIFLYEITKKTIFSRVFIGIYLERSIHRFSTLPADFLPALKRNPEDRFAAIMKEQLKDIAYGRY